jgi:hypothetical protein
MAHLKGLLWRSGTWRDNKRKGNVRWLDIWKTRVGVSFSVQKRLLFFDTRTGEGRTHLLGFTQNSYKHVYQVSVSSRLNYKILCANHPI